MTAIPPSKTDADALSGGKTLGRNMVWNFLGMGLPTLIAVATIPRLIHDLGEARFGILTLIWLLFGYFTIFDLGLHRAVTQLVAKALGEGRPERVTPLFWTALLIMALAGCVGLLCVGLGAHGLVHRVLNVSEGLRPETVAAFLIVAVALPVLVSTAGLRGVVEAHQRFRGVFVVQMWQGTWTFLGPLLVAQFTPHLGWVVAGLLVGRLITWAAYFTLSLRAAPQVLTAIRPSRDAVRPLVTYGGWMTLTHAVVPIILYGDRLLIGSILSMEDVAYYVTPAEVVTKMLILPTAIMGVLFPAFAATYQSNLARTAMLFNRGLKAVFLLFLPAATLAVALAPEVLRVWLSDDFAVESTRVMQLLVVGVFFNGLSLIAIALTQGVGRPQIGAILFCVELPLTLALMWWLTARYGIEGAATAWLIRGAVDALVLLGFAQWIVGGGVSQTARQAALAAAAAVALGLVAVPESLALRATGAAALLLVTALLGWRWVLSTDERALIAERLGRKTDPEGLPNLPESSCESAQPAVRRD